MRHRPAHHPSEAARLVQRPVRRALDAQWHDLGQRDIAGVGPRQVRLHVPAGLRQPRPLLVLWDGQNVFGDAGSYAGGWHTHQAVHRLPRRAAPMVLALDHGGTARIDDLTPWHTAVPLEGQVPPQETLERPKRPTPHDHGHEHRGGHLPHLLSWLTQELLPEVHHRSPGVCGMPLRAGPRHTAIGGSSLGGLASLYAHFSYPEVFGTCLALSPSIWFGGARLLRWLAEHPMPEQSRISLDVGDRESMQMRVLAHDLAVRLARNGWAPHAGSPRQLWWQEVERAGHTEKAWRRRFPAVLRYAFDPNWRPDL